MKSVNIWFLVDNADGLKLAHAVKDLGLSVNIIKKGDFSTANILTEQTNIFIVDLKKKKLPTILSMIRDDSRLNSFLKFIILPKKEIRKAVNISLNIMHIEFISRPVNPREFILLLEKSIMVEKYKEIMKLVSKDSEARIGAFESLMEILRKDVFVTDKEREAFEQIINYEKHLMLEQAKLNKAIKEFTLLRQKDLFDLQNRIKAEEMLAELRRAEMIDAQNVIKAQEAVIDFSAKELHEAGRIIDATERVQELSRQEAIALHEQLRKERARVKELEEEVKRLQEELAKYKGC